MYVGRNKSKKESIYEFLVVVETLGDARARRNDRETVRVAPRPLAEWRNKYVDRALAGTIKKAEDGVSARPNGFQPGSSGADAGGRPQRGIG